ncbi:hypothetical protein QTP70_019804 [Hemibagrus guttatus]|uniref:Retrotransposon gag domain-containing protein n=1 Tax=Hemibagrus guttatus TaxID=175788 RepID=A0AAE0VA93_9TELE|nr:hypothetical protein QTP70_019804 [Hemibagrus guttatus]
MTAHQLKLNPSKTELLGIPDLVQYREDTTKFAFMLSLLTGRALDWASVVWDSDPWIRTSADYFAGQIHDVFEYPAVGKDISVQLLELCQGSNSAADYAVQFCTLSAQSGWNDAALLAVFREGLNLALQAEMACRDSDTTLSLYIGMAIRLDNLRCQHHASKHPRPQPCRYMEFHAPREDHPEPLQLGRARIAEREQDRQRRRNLRLCFYCRQSGH